MLCTYLVFRDGVREQAAAISLVTQTSQEPAQLDDKHVSTHYWEIGVKRLSLGTDCNFPWVVNERASIPSVAFT